MTGYVKVKLLARNGGFDAGTIVPAVHRYGREYAFYNADGNEDTVWVVEDESNPTEETWAGVIVEEAVNDSVVHPPHYNDVEGMPEVWDILDAFFPDNPLLWNAGKYLLRAGKKEGNEELQELEKMVQYAQRRIEKLEGGASE